MSPFPRRFSAPVSSRMTLELIPLDTANAILPGRLDLSVPVITSLLGLWVARIMWIPAALAFAAILPIAISISFPTTAMISANSSIINRM